MLETLMEASRNGNIEEMKTILEADPELLNAAMPNGNSPLTAALYHGKQAAVEYLLELGVPVSIHEAAALGDPDVLAYMLDLEQDLISRYSFDGWTALHLASFFGGHAAVELLLKRGADANACSRNSLQNMPIHAAAAGKRTAIVHLLLQHGADPNVKQDGGWTPLHQATAHYDRGMVELLLDFGADPFIVNDEGKNAIQIAEEHQYEDIAALLRERGKK